MVDSVSGNAASRSARLDLQLAGGRDRVDSPVGRRDVAAPDAPTRTSDGPGFVSEGRDVVRRMAAEPPVDTQRVKDLRDAIAAGGYRIDPDRIADAMLRSEPDLFRS